MQPLLKVKGQIVYKMAVSSRRGPDTATDTIDLTCEPLRRKALLIWSRRLVRYIS